MKHKSLEPNVLDQIMNRIREIAPDPYMLLTAFLLDSLKSVVDDEEGEFWGSTIPESLYIKTINSCIADFKEAGENGLGIDIDGKSYTIRKFNTIDMNKAKDIIQFPKKGDDVLVCKDMVFNVKYESLDNYEDRAAEWADRRDYHRKVLMLSETDDGWDKLTDIEVAMYCWGVWIKNFISTKHISIDDVKLWYDKYKDYHGLKMNEITNCFTDYVLESEKYNQRAAFSAIKIRNWNIKHKQLSVVDNISHDEVDKYWYTVGCTKYPVK